MALLALAALVLFSISASSPRRAAVSLPNPILFVTQVPIPADFTTITSVFGNHDAAIDKVGRGGDLYIRYPDGTLRNLTAAAGFGTSGFQGASAIAVRDPSVHWSGTKAVFSMAVGAPSRQYVYSSYYFQLYEITGLGPTDTPVITLVPNQPAQYNNVSPIYGSDDRIIFTSDRPRSGERHLYPQRDEYEEAPSTSGVWSLNPSTGQLILLDHSPSGDFTPILDSFGRVVFTRWDHLQRDQQADADATEGGTYGTFNYPDETAAAIPQADRSEVFPEPRSSRADLLVGTNLEGHSFNQFFPWQVNEDGTEHETLNHIGRHELHGYFNRSVNDDSNVQEFVNVYPSRFNPNVLFNFLEVKEDPAVPGNYFGVDAPEFSTHASGQIVSMSAPPTLPADRIAVAYVTHRDTESYTAEGGTPSPNHSGHYRDPLPLSDGTLVAVHTPETRADRNEGTRANPASRYDFRLKTLRRDVALWVADQPLTSGISKTVSYYDPDVLVSYSGPLWELQPVEVRARPRPVPRTAALPAVEQAVFAQENVNPAVLQNYLRKNNLALVVSRNVTTRDRADHQQPFNLQVAGSSTQSIGASGKIYQVAHVQFFQADLIRGIGGTTAPRAGRRVLSQVLHDAAVKNPPNAGGPPGSVHIAADGSMAAFVPARRAMTWQLTDGAGSGIVRERYWLSFQPGEIRVCTSCHGLNSRDQAGQTTPANEPQALHELLQYWKTLPQGSPIYLPFLTR